MRQHNCNGAPFARQHRHAWHRHSAGRHYGRAFVLAMLLTETPQLPQSGSQWLMLAMLIIVCTGFGFTLQPMAQSHVSTARAGLFCAVSPAIAALLGVTVLGEPFGTLDVLGLVLILASIVYAVYKGLIMITSQIQATYPTT